MGKMTAVAYNNQVSNHLAECDRVGVIMDNDDILSHQAGLVSLTRVELSDGSVVCAVYLGGCIMSSPGWTRLTHSCRAE